MVLKKTMLLKFATFFSVAGFITATFSNRNTLKLKVCVIGAGPAGIATTRHLADNLDKFKITVFEKASDIGGQWLYTDETGIDKNGYQVHSSIYKNLRTNAPKELMNLADWPVYKGVNVSCLSHYKVHEYLKNYTEFYQLRSFIKFNTIVENVEVEKNSASEKWKVTVKNIKTQIRTIFLFDKVIVCNGRFFSPNTPVIPGLENFNGTVFHSHNYRKPDGFKGKKVIILGAGSSGLDIAQELQTVTSKVYLSHNHDSLHVSLPQIKGVDKFENGLFVLKDNTTVSANVLITCTGYDYKFPFLDNSTGISVDDNFIFPIYKHMINVQHPSMVFVGFPLGSDNFLMFHTQAQFAVSYLADNVKIPSKEVMMEDAKLKTSKKRDAHKVADWWGYLDELAYLGNFKPFPEYYKVGHKVWAPFVKSNLNNFKNYNLVFSNDKKSAKVVKQENSEFFY